MRRNHDPADMLRWYPSSWRDRYGAELMALIEDDLDGRTPTLRFRVSMAGSGMRQRVRSAGLGGDAPADLRVRSGSLLVLVSWSAVLLGAAAFAKAAEHSDVAPLSSDHRLAIAAYETVGALVLGGALLVAVGAALAFPSTARFIRRGGWSAVRTPIVVAAMLTAIAGLATMGLVAWAHRLTAVQRNGGSTFYGVAFFGWATLVAGALGAWTWAGLLVARRIDLERNTLRLEAGIALAVAAILGVTSAAVTVWWLAMARAAPWFLAGARPGTRPSVVTVQMVVIDGWMVAATVAALYGATRVTRALRTT